MLELIDEKKKVIQGSFGNQISIIQPNIGLT